MRLFRIILVSLAILVACSAQAKPLVCEKVVVSGEMSWPPFSYMKDGELQGVGIDLARILFTELNIPVEVVPVQRHDDLSHMLDTGRVDFLVATYDEPRYHKNARLIYPPYFEDNIGVVTHTRSAFDVYDWHALMGKTGLTTNNNQLGIEFNEFAQEYLNIQSEGNVRFNMRKLARGDYEYLIGSEQMLKMGLAWYDKKQEFIFLPTLVAGEDLFFAFSERSECLPYAAFIRDKIAQYKESGVIYSLVQKHAGSDEAFHARYKSDLELGPIDQFMKGQH